jgi:hypothetical protein
MSNFYDLTAIWFKAVSDESVGEVQEHLYIEQGAVAVDKPRSPRFCHILYLR